MVGLVGIGYRRRVDYKHGRVRKRLCLDSFAIFVFGSGWD